MGQINEDPVLPGSSFDRNQSVCGTVKTTDATEIGCPFQLSFQRIRPTVIGASQLTGGAFWFSHYRRCMMTANVEKPADLIVVASSDHYRLSSDFRSDIATRLAQLIDTSSVLPRIGKDS